MIFFLLLGLLPAVTIAVAVAALPELKKRFSLPPIVAILEPYRWLIVTGVTLVALFFLLLQAVTSFSIESRTRGAIKPAAQTGNLNPIDAKWLEILQGKEEAASGLRRTSSLRLAFTLLIVAAGGAAAAHWLEHRGKGRPLPRIELMW
jgi:hypothetical protein